MKWNVFLGTLVLGVGLSAQSFGFELLDRMLGVGGCGCEPRATKCGCDPKCGVDPKCGCEPKGRTQKGGDPKCGATQKGCCEGRPLPRLGSLLDRLFTCNRCGARATGCADKGCWDGCEDGKGKTTKADKADGKKDGPMPPAPVVDPSAYMSSYKVIPASRIVR